jgi:hypothetical protein
MASTQGDGLYLAAADGSTFERVVSSISGIAHLRWLDDQRIAFDTQYVGL